MVVAPTCDEYFARPWDLRLGALSLVTLSHMVDYWAMQSYGDSANAAQMRNAVADERNAVVASYADWQVLTDAADAVKHGRLAQIARSREISGADELQVTKGLFQAPFGQGRFAGGMDLFFEASDRRVSVRALLAEALAYWRARLNTSE